MLLPPSRPLRDTIAPGGAASLLLKRRYALKSAKPE